MAFDKKKKLLDWQFLEAKCRSLLVMIMFWCPKGTRDLRGVLNGFNSSAIGKVGSSIQIVVSKLRDCGFWEIRVARVLGSTRHAEFLSGGSRQANVLLTLTLARLGPVTCCWLIRPDCKGWGEHCADGTGHSQPESEPDPTCSQLEDSGVASAVRLVDCFWSPACRVSH